jgi:hypothetical protein
MSLTRIVCLSLSAAALGLGGCSAPQEATDAGQPSVALGAFAPAVAAPETAPGAYPLGAGDALGREVFRYYVACLRAYEHYATGESDFPQPR